MTTVEHRERVLAHQENLAAAAAAGRALVVEIGRRFGDLTIVCEVFGWADRRMECRCICGRTIIITRVDTLTDSWRGFACDELHAVQRGIVRRPMDWFKSWFFEPKPKAPRYSALTKPAKQTPTNAELVDLAIKYGMINSRDHSAALNGTQRRAVLNQIIKVAVS